MKIRKSTTVIVCNLLTLSLPVVPEYKGGIVEPGFFMFNNAPLWHYLLSEQPKGFACLFFHLLVATITALAIFHIFSMFSKKDSRA